MSERSGTEGLLFIHTIDGKPGYFDGEQLVYAELRGRWLDTYELVKPRTSVDQIRDDQIKSERFRLRHRWDVPQYDYIIVTTGRRRVLKSEECKIK